MVGCSFIISQICRRRQNKKRALARRTAILPPEKQMGFAAQNRNFPNKTGARAPVCAILSNFGGVLQPSSNWIWARGLKRKLSPDACGRTRPLAPPEKPFAYFFIPPAEFLFWNWKGCFWWWRVALATPATVYFFMAFVIFCAFIAVPNTLSTILLYNLALALSV